jgi:hypothetical protein
MINKDFNQITQRTRQYWFSDGLAELVTGLVFLMLGLYFYLQATMPPGSLLVNLLQVSFVLIVLGAAFFGKRAIRMLKDRLTVPRTGYVAYPPADRRHRWIGALLAMIMAALVARLVVSMPAALDLLPALTGLILAAIWLITTARIGLLRFYLLAVISFALGLVLSLIGLGDTLGVAYLYASIGLILVFSGGTVLHNYLRRNKPPEAVE